jgi:hypothetical protein
MTLFESLAYEEFDAPFDNVGDLAAFILNPENTGPVYQVLRDEIREHLTGAEVAFGNYAWSMTIIGLVRGLPPARALLAAAPVPVAEIAVACRTLDRAVAILRGG